MVAGDPQRIGLDPTISKLIARTPLPNNFTVGDGLNTAGFTFSSPARERQRDLTFKVDHIFNAKNTVFARIAWGRQDTNCDSDNAGLALFPGEPCAVNTQREPRNLAFNWRANPTPRITNELVVGQSVFMYNFLTPGQTLDNLWIQGPVTLPGILDYGNLRHLKTYQVVENFGCFRGSHALKFGANLRYQQHIDERGSVAGANVMQSVDFSTSVNTVDVATFGIPADVNTANDLPVFRSAINLMLGRVGNISRAFVAQGDKFVNDIYTFDARYPEYDFYAQDSWKVRKNLTIDLGLRWEVKLSPTDAEGRMKHPNQADGGRRRAEQHPALGEGRPLRQPVEEPGAVAGHGLGPHRQRANIDARQLPPGLRPHQHFRALLAGVPEPAGQQHRRHQHGFRAEGRPHAEPAQARAAFHQTRRYGAAAGVFVRAASPWWTRQ